MTNALSGFSSPNATNVRNLNGPLATSRGQRDNRETEVFVERSHQGRRETSSNSDTSQAHNERIRGDQTSDGVAGSPSFTAMNFEGNGGLETPRGRHHEIDKKTRSRSSRNKSQEQIDQHRLTEVHGANSPNTSADRPSSSTATDRADGNEMLATSHRQRGVFERNTLDEWSRRSHRHSRSSHDKSQAQDDQLRRANVHGKNNTNSSANAPSCSIATDEASENGILERSRRLRDEFETNALDEWSHRNRRHSRSSRDKSQVRNDQPRLADIHGDNISNSSADAMHMAGGNSALANSRRRRNEFETHTHDEWSLQNRSRSRSSRNDLQTQDDQQHRRANVHSKSNANWSANERLSAMNVADRNGALAKSRRQREEFETQTFDERSPRNRKHSRSSLDKSQARGDQHRLADIHGDNTSNAAMSASSTDIAGGYGGLEKSRRQRDEFERSAMAEWSPRNHNETRSSRDKSQARDANGQQVDVLDDNMSSSVNDLSSVTATDLTQGDGGFDTPGGQLDEIETNAFVEWLRHRRHGRHSRHERDKITHTNDNSQEHDTNARVADVHRARTANEPSSSFATDAAGRSGVLASSRGQREEIDTRTPVEWSHHTSDQNRRSRDKAQGHDDRDRLVSVNNAQHPPTSANKLLSSSVADIAEENDVLATPRGHRDEIELATYMEWSQHGRHSRHRHDKVNSSSDNSQEHDTRPADVHGVQTSNATRRALSSSATHNTDTNNILAVSPGQLEEIEMTTQTEWSRYSRSPVRPSHNAPGADHVVDLKQTPSDAALRRSNALKALHHGQLSVAGPTEAPSVSTVMSTLHVHTVNECEPYKAPRPSNDTKMTRAGGANTSGLPDRQVRTGNDLPGTNQGTRTRETRTSEGARPARVANTLRDAIKAARSESQPGPFVVESHYREGYSSRGNINGRTGNTETEIRG